MADFTEITNKDENGNVITLATLLSKINTALSNMDKKINTSEEIAEIRRNGIYATYRLSDLLKIEGFAVANKGQTFNVTTKLDFKITHGKISCYSHYIDDSDSFTSIYTYNNTSTVSQSQLNDEIYFFKFNSNNSYFGVYGTYKIDNDNLKIDWSFTVQKIDDDFFPIKFEDRDKITIELY